MLNSNIRNLITVCQQMSSNNLFKDCYVQTFCLQIMYKQDLALNNLLGLIYCKALTNQLRLDFIIFYLDINILFDVAIPTQRTFCYTLLLTNKFLFIDKNIAVL